MERDPFALGGVEQPATADTMAQIEFEPIEDADEICEALSAERLSPKFNSLGVNLRVAGSLADKTKAELIDITRRLVADDEGRDSLFEIIDCLHNAAADTKAMSKLLTAVHIRLMCATAVAATETEGGAA